MSFSANFCAYLDMPNFSSQSAICCIAALHLTPSVLTDRTESLPRTPTYCSAQGTVACPVRVIFGCVGQHPDCGSATSARRNDEGRGRASNKNLGMAARVLQFVNSLCARRRIRSPCCG